VIVSLEALPSRSSSLLYLPALVTRAAPATWGPNAYAQLGHLPNASGSGDGDCGGGGICNPLPKPITNLP
jgi:hypothetical protein